MSERTYLYGFINFWFLIFVHFRLSLSIFLLVFPFFFSFRSQVLRNSTSRTKSERNSFLEKQKKLQGTKNTNSQKIIDQKDNKSYFYLYFLGCLYHIPCKYLWLFFYIGFIVFFNVDGVYCYLLFFVISILSWWQVRAVYDILVSCRLFVVLIIFYGGNFSELRLILFTSDIEVVLHVKNIVPFYQSFIFIFFFFASVILFV